MPAYLETAIRDIEGRGELIGKLVPNKIGLALWWDEEDAQVTVTRPNGVVKPLDASIHVFGAENGLIYVLPSGTGITSIRLIKEDSPYCVEGYHPRMGTLKAWPKPKDGLTDGDYELFTWLDIVGVTTMDLDDF